MISKDMEDSGSGKPGKGAPLPGDNGQVNETGKLEISTMSQTDTAVNSAPGERVDAENREDRNASSDNVHNLLGRCFNGDLIASQVYLCITCGIEMEDTDTLKRHELHCCSVDIAPAPLSLPGMSADESESFRKLVCEICRAYFSETDHLQDHKLLHLNSSNVCYLCDTYFVNRYLVAQHVVSQHSERFGVKQNEEGVHEPYTCTVCILRFSTLIGLQSHEDSHGITEKTPTCRVCSLSHSEPQAMQSHLKSSIHAEMKFQLQNLFTCIDCSTVFHSRDSYAMHMMMRAKDESCKKPNKNMSQKVAVLPEPTSIVVIKEEPKDPIEGGCSDLPSTSYPQAETSQLIPTKTESPSSASATHVCPGCGMFYDSNHLASHLRTCRNMLQPQVADPWGQAANGLVFKWAINKTYSLHMPSALGRKEKTCSYCEKVFFDQDDLAMHVMSDHASQLAEPETSPSPTTNARCIKNNANVLEQNGTARPPWFLMPSGSTIYPEVAAISNEFTNTPGQNMEIKLPDSNNQERTEMMHCVEKSSASLSPVEQSCAISKDRLSAAAQSGLFVHKRRRGRSSSYLFLPESQSSAMRPKSVEMTVRPLLDEPFEKRTRLDSSSPIGGSVSCPLDLSLGADQDTVVDKSKPQHTRSIDSRQIASNGKHRENDLQHVRQELNVKMNHADSSMVVSDELFVSSKAFEKDSSHPSSGHETPHSGSEYAMSGEGSTKTNGSASTEADQERSPPIADFLLENRNRMCMCKFCEIIFLDRTLYCLHMGLHNVNNPWQCNMCSQSFESVNDFSSHVLHF